MSLTGLSLDKALLALAYEGLLVAIPGLLLSLALTPGRSALSHAALAWPFGIAIELVVFAATAAVDVRVFAAPLQVVVAVALLAIPSVQTALGGWRRSTAASAARIPIGGLLLMAVVALAILLLLVLQYYLPSPLPGTVPAVAYYVDVPFQIALGAEAANHWPMMDPNLAGEPLRYHIFSYLHMAAVHEATGAGIDQVVLRTFPLAPLAAMTLVVFALGRAVGGRLLTGAIAVVLLLLVGEFDFSTIVPFPYFNVFLLNLWYSPSFLFGMPFCGAIFLLLIDTRETGRRFGALAALALMVAAATGAKGSVMPVILGGLGVLALWIRLTERRWSRETLTALAVSVPVFLIVYAWLFAGGAGGISLSLGSFLQFTVLLPLGSSVSVVEKAIYVPFVLVLMWVALVGILPAVLYRSFDRKHLILLAMLVPAVALFVGTSQSGGNQFYFAYCGFLAGVVVSADGLIHLGKRLSGVSPRPVVAAGIATALVGSGSLAYSHFHATNAKTFAIVTLALVLLIAFLVAVAWREGRSGGRAWAGPVAVVAVTLVVAGMFDAPGDVVEAADSGLRGDRLYQVPDPPALREINSEVLAAMAWLRGASDVDDVLIVNNQRRTTGTGGPDARYFDYAAFAERRTFLGGWYYSPLGLATDSGPLRERIRINRAVLRARSCEDLNSALAEASAQFVLYDHINGSASEPLGRFIDPVYESPNFAIYDVRDCDTGASSAG